MLHAPLPALTGIRAFAAYAVVLWHATLFVDQLYPGLRHGYMGVDLFFMLSGFILSYVHGEEFRQPGLGRYARFLALRLGRIWPAYIVALLFVVMPQAVREQWWRDPSHPENAVFVAHFFMLQNWGIVRPDHFNWPGWSVSAEWMLYLVFPVFLAVFGAVRRAAAPWLMAALLLALALIANSAGERGVNLTGPLGLVRGACEFSIGVMLWRLYRNAVVAAWRWDWIGSAAGAALVVATLILPSWTNADYLIVALMPPLLLTLAYGQGPLARLCASRPLLFLGEISYAVYLVSWGCMWRLNTLALKNVLPQSAVVLVLATLLLSTLAGIMLHFLVERPCRRLVRRWLQRREGYAV
jgi:peptidoglycan/LPS O-acetylase OafA/YrhL